MTTQRWSFGVEPLPESRELAERMRSVTGLVLSLEASHPVLARLAAALREAEGELQRFAPADPAPRIRAGAPAEQRVYLDHSRHIGAYNPMFPAYRLEVEGDRAHGTVSFPLAYEGPPGVVHGGFLAVFFDCAVQHHNCDLGLAGKTTALTVRFRRPTPLLVPLSFEIERALAEGRITSTARLLDGDAVLCEAEVRAFAGSLEGLPAVSPRRPGG